MRQRGWRLLVKRALDVGIAGAALGATTPLWAGTALAIRVSMGAPVLFRQERVGRDGRIFLIYKFRTMKPAPPDASLEGDAQRITPLGRFLRSTSLDELPQLLNVLRGDMSLVGPRPLLVRYAPRYTPRQARRHEVLPGLTGQAQVHGRNSVAWEERFEHDVWYVDNWSLRRDLAILLKTARTVVQREGIAADGHATMPEFLGSEPA